MHISINIINYKLRICIKIDKFYFIDRCKEGHIGANCEACDIENISGKGHWANS